MVNRKQYDIILHTLGTVLDFNPSMSIPAVVMCQSLNTIDQLWKMFNQSPFYCCAFWSLYKDRTMAMFNLEVVHGKKTP